MTKKRPARPTPPATAPISDSTNTPAPTDRERPDWIVVRRSALTGTAAFAGAAAPFRSSAERDTLFSRYAQATIVDEQAGGSNALVILRRAR
jgi:hypothetical protein